MRRARPDRAGGRAPALAPPPAETRSGGLPVVGGLPGRTAGRVPGRRGPGGGGWGGGGWRGGGCRGRRCLSADAADQLADRHGLAAADNHVEHAVGLSLDVKAGLVRLDLREHVPLVDLLAIALLPLEDGAL